LHLISRIGSDPRSEEESKCAMAKG
jgi:hypothetical protein